MKIKDRIVNILLIFLIFFVAPCSKESYDSEYASIEKRVYDLVNAHRINQNLNKLVWNDIIAEQCRSHSENMAAGSVEFGHDGFNERVENIKKKITVIAAAENVACNLGQAEPAQAAVDGWLGSPGHRQNIEGNYQLTGVGVASKNNVYYFTQLFIRSE